MAYPIEATRFLQMVDYSLLRTIVRSVSSDQHALCATNLVPLLGSHTYGWELLSSLLNAEVEQTVQEECLFREESIASKVLSEFARRFGSGYIQTVVYPLIAICAKGKHSFELDRTKLQTADPSLSPEACEKLAQKATKHLQRKVTLFLDTIFASVKELPMSLILLSKLLSDSVSIKYGQEKGNLSLSGFIFLRFVCPSILAPEPTLLASLCKDKALEMRLRRGLVLVAKIIQNIANGVQFKEPYMQVFNGFITEQMKRRDAFFKEILTTANNQENVQQLAIKQVCFDMNLPQDLHNCICQLADKVILKNFYHIKKKSRHDGTLERLKKLYSVLPLLQVQTSNIHALKGSSATVEAPAKWSVERVQQWLGEISLAEIQSIFAASRVDGAKLLTLTTYDSFNEIPGLSACKLPIKKLLKTEVNRLVESEKPGSNTLSSNPHEWRSNEVRKWLIIQGAESVTSMFDAHAIGGEELLTLQEKDLVNIGIAALGVRKRLMKAINELKVNGFVPPKSRSYIVLSSSESSVLSTTKEDTNSSSSGSPETTVSPILQPLTKSSSETAIEKDKFPSNAILGLQRVRHPYISSTIAV